MKFTLFYDGFCPLCLWEMRKLKRQDVQHRIQFVDIQHPDFPQNFPDLNWQALNARIHARLSNGNMVTGLEATYHAWHQVGKGWIYAPLRWPVIRWFADKLYNGFARYRYQISYALTGQKRCTQCIPLSLEEQMTEMPSRGHSTRAKDQSKEKV